MFTSRFTFKRSRILVGVLLLALQGFALMVPAVVYGETGFWEGEYEQGSLQASNTGAADSAVLNPGNAVSIKWGCNPLTLSFAGCLSAVLYTGMTWAAALSSATGRLLNTTILMLVSEMSSSVGSGTSGGDAVEHAWTILRDVANVLLVFLAVFIGLATIVGATRYGYKQLLFKVVLAAIFVNFSITLARVVIDTSNVLALSIFESIVGEGACLQRADYERDANDSCLNAGVAGVFFNAVRLQQFLGKGALAGQVQANAAGDYVINPEATSIHRALQWVSLLGMIMFLVMAFVFLLSSALIFVRFFALTFIMILSPIGLVAWITGMHSVGHKWWHQLLNQSFFLPVLFLMWLVSLRMLEGMQGAFFERESTDLFARAAASVGVEMTSGVAYFGIFIYFALTIASLLFSLKLARDMGAAGANTIINTGNSWAKKAGYAVAGAGVATAAFATRNTAGRAVDYGAQTGRKFIGGTMNKFAESTWLKEQHRGGGKIKRWAVENTRDWARGEAEKATYDPRALGGKRTERWLGKAKQGGFKADVAAEKKRDDDILAWSKSETGTQKEKGARDAEMRGVVARADRVSEQSAKKEDRNRFEQWQGLTNEISQLEKDISTGSFNPTEIATKQERLREANQELGKVNDHKTQSLERGTLMQQIANRKDENGVDLTADDIAQRQRRVDELSQNLRSSYGLVDTDVAKLEKDASELERQYQVAKDAGDAEAVKNLGTALKSLNGEKEAMINLFEARRKLYEMEGTWKQNGQTDEINKTKQDIENASKVFERASNANAAGIDAKYSGMWKARGEARAQTVLTRMSGERGMFGAPLADSKREFAMKNRGANKDKQLMDDLRKWMKEKEEAAATEASGTPAPGTPAEGAPAAATPTPPTTS